MLQQSDGFSKAEIQEIKVGVRLPGRVRIFACGISFAACPYAAATYSVQATFKKFDEDGSGDIDVCELSDMLRFQGHHTSIDEATGP